MTSAASLAPARTTPLITSSPLGCKAALLKYVRTPQLVVVGTIQGALFLLIFRYMFGGTIGAGELRYVDFLVPGFM